MLRNPLAFPGTRPGFIPGHVAAKGIRPGHGISVVALPDGRMRNLLTGAIGATNSTPTSSIKGIVGTVVDYTSSGFTSFAGQNAVQDPFNTIAAICIPTGTQGICASSTCDTALTGFSLIVNGTNIQIITGSGFGTSVPIVLNIPYFVVSCNDINGNNQSMIAINLNTGQIVSALNEFFDVGADGASTGTYEAGFNTICGAGGIVVAWMYAPSFLSNIQMIQWANDPWSFWYPKPIGNVVGSSVASTFGNNMVRLMM